MFETDNSKPLDFQKSDYSANTFSHATGINTFVLKYDDTKTFLRCNCDSKYCELMQKATEMDLQCCEAHRFAGIQSERFGGKYIYFCPLGLVHFISPLMSRGELVGAIAGGPIVMIEHEEFFFEEITAHEIHKDYFNSLYRELKKIPFVSPERVSSLSEMLFITTAYINRDEQVVQARDILEQQSTISETIHRIKEQDTETVFYPINKERELLSKISSGDKIGARELLNDILGHIFFSSGGNFEIIKARVLELLVLLSRGAMEGGADTAVIFGMNYNYLNEINNFKNIEQLTAWLSQIMVRFAETVFDMKDIKHADVIMKAIEYIKRNYMKKITLEEVADHIYLSPSYFSKVFSDEMKCSFNTYLNHIRIDNAKLMLINDIVPLVNVSELCGFEDQSYFTKVFKKLVGITPGKFKESRGRAKTNKEN